MAHPLFPVVTGTILIGGAVYVASGPEQRALMERSLVQVGEKIQSLLGPLFTQGGGEGEKGTKGSGNETEITPRPDYPPQSGGRSGERVKDASGPPNNAIPSSGGSVWITDGKGNVVVDVTPERAKPVKPGVGFGEKRPPTQTELDLWSRVKGPNGQ
jgi:hypothetical protein